MTVSVRSLYDQAQRLTPEEQADLIDLLLTSGQPDDTGLDYNAWTAAWAAEVEARVRSLEQGDAEAIPADDVIAEGRRRLAAMRQGT